MTTFPFDGAGLFARPYLESRLDDIRSAEDVVARIELYGHRTLVFVQPCLVYGLEICLVVARIWDYGYGKEWIFGRAVDRCRVGSTKTKHDGGKNGCEGQDEELFHGCTVF